MLLTATDAADITGDSWNAAIRRSLIERRRQLMDEIQGRVRKVREEGPPAYHYAAGAGDTTETEPEDDLAFALIQMRTDALKRVDEALEMVDEGTYGCCGDCGYPIATPRLLAMPFAARCRGCEEARENEQRRARTRAPRHGHLMASAS